MTDDDLDAGTASNCPSCLMPMEPTASSWHCPDCKVSALPK